MVPEQKSPPLRVSSCSHQGGKARYPKKVTSNSKEDVEAPSIATYRNNLTALSQYRNLLFVAYVDKVHVYTPSYPEQTITTKPKVVIDLPRSKRGLKGYLDPGRPHAVNHLIVGDLGDEEVVVVACDDGDVISYNVRAIALAIEEGANTVFGPDLYQDRNLIRYRIRGWSNLILPVADTHVTAGFRVLAAWFHENVGASAWGLATHKDAMLLAVSSNTKEIYVFAPSRRPVRDQPSRSTPQDQSLGRKITLRGHGANIPSVAFCDNDLDPEGRYLASTDIDGVSIIWDVLRCTRILESHHKSHTYARGWAVACLDPRTSRLCDGPVDTFGCPYRVDENNNLIDNMVHDNSQWHPGFSALGSVPGTLPTGPMPLALQPAAVTTADLSLESEDEADEEVNEEPDDLDILDGAFDGDAVDDGEETDVLASEQVLHVEPSVHTQGLEAPPPDPFTLLSTLQNVDVGQSLDGLGLLDFEIWQNDQQATESNDQSQHDPLGSLEFIYPAAEEHDRPLSPDLKRDADGLSNHSKTCPSFIDLPFNLLQTDERDIHLFRDIRFDAKSPPDSTHSQVLCQQALNQAMNQRITPGYNYLAQGERLNMIVQIQELGVVVIGNQVGRVGILTMTRWEARKQSAYKIECILPSKSEEEKELRPRKSLMGIAVGPIQGQETALPRGSPRRGAQTPRRFRLLMTYCDHTILSYEISRPDGEENLLVV